MSAQFSALALASVALVATPALGADKVRIGGTGGALEILRIISEPLRAADGAVIEVLPSLGSAGALRAVLAGAIELAISARSLTAEEATKGLKAVPFASTPLVFVTSHATPDAMTSKELVAAFAAKDPRWRDGSPIRLILRPRSDFDTQLMIQIFPGMGEAVAAARKRPDLPMPATDQDSAELAGQLRGSLVQAGYGQIIAEKRGLRFITLDGVAPSIESMSEGRYQHKKLFYLVYPAAGSEPAERLLGFIRSPGGRALFRANGYLVVD
jgi:phosphate transport system substrate-binding protein